ncbi:hypothetical protein TWF694_009901 [Orbilia ellipsospora]|uniref:Uncharacterized protein n=1 Tax=Orbilia ellipsospora TaxID=2528407 RepID=A0AAV9XCQ5_9PEZI
MPLALHTFLAPRKPEFFPPLPGLPAYNSISSSTSHTAPSLFEDLHLEDDIIFDEVFLDIMGLNEAAQPRHVEPLHNYPRKESIVAPLFHSRRKASLANCLAVAPPNSTFELKNIDRLRQTRSKSISSPSAYYRTNKPLPLLPPSNGNIKAEFQVGGWSGLAAAASPGNVNFTNYSMPRKMSTPNAMNRFFGLSSVSGNSAFPVTIPQSPQSPKQSNGPSSL